MDVTKRLSPKRDAFYNTNTCGFFNRRLKKKHGFAGSGD